MPTTANLEKLPELLQLLDRLELEARGWSIVDEWEVDLAAVGVSSAKHPDRIFYISVFGQPPGRLYHTRDLRTDDNHLHTLSDGHITVLELLPLMTRFLDADELWS